MNDKIITANWIVGDVVIYPPKVDYTQLSRDEQADLIIEKLSKPYVPPEELLEEIFAKVMAEEIQKEIDDEILRKFAIPDKNLNNTSLTQTEIKTIFNRHYGK